MTQLPIVCQSCGGTFKVATVTADLRCGCGSDDLDLDLRADHHVEAVGPPPNMSTYEKGRWDSGLGVPKTVGSSFTDEERAEYDRGYEDRKREKRTPWTPGRWDGEHTSQMFPGPGAQVYYNEAGEPTGWDNPSYDEPYDDDDDYGARDNFMEEVAERGEEAGEADAEDGEPKVTHPPDFFVLFPSFGEHDQYDRPPPGGWESVYMDAYHDGYNNAKPRTASMRKGAPFAGYKDFAACVAANRDKRNPDAYCGYIKHKVEDKKTSAYVMSVLGPRDRAAADREVAAHFARVAAGGPGRNIAPGMNGGERPEPLVYRNPDGSICPGGEACTGECRIDRPREWDPYDPTFASRRSSRHHAAASGGPGYYVLAQGQPIAGPFGFVGDARDALVGARGDAVQYIGNSGEIKDLGPTEEFINPSGRAWTDQQIGAFAGGNENQQTPLPAAFGAKLNEVTAGIRQTNPGMAQHTAEQIAVRTVEKFPGMVKISGHSVEQYSKNIGGRDIGPFWRVRDPNGKVIDDNNGSGIFSEKEADRRKYLYDSAAEEGAKPNRPADRKRSARVERY